MTKIRPYEDRDEEEVINIYAASKMDELINEKEGFVFLPLKEDFERHKKLLESKIFVYEESKVIGYCAYFNNEIRALYVLPGHRGRGIGKQMFEFMLNEIIENPILFVAKTNNHAKKIYEKYGFEVVDEFQTKYNGQVVLANKMKKMVNKHRFLPER